MSEPLVCQNPACGHAGDLHDDQTGICLAAECKCLGFWIDDGFEDEDEAEIEPLDFDHGL